MSNIELLKKNGELIAKYHNKLTNEVRRLTDEPVDDEAISRCNSEMLSILNEFAFERDKLYGVDLDQVTVPFVQEDNDRHWIIKLHDKVDNMYNNVYVGFFRYNKDNGKFVWKIDSLKELALSLTYTKADEYAKILSEYAKKNNMTFVPEVVDYNKEGVELITDKNYIIHLIDKKNPDNEGYITYWNFDDSNSYDYDYEDSLSRKNASKYTYEDANKIALKLKEKIGKYYDVHVEPFEVLTTDEILEKAYSPKEQKLYKLHIDQITYLMRPEEFERFVSGKATEVLMNLFDDTDQLLGTQTFSATADVWGPYVVINEKRYRPDDFTLIDRDKALEKDFSLAKKAYETIMNTESKRKDRSQEFNRTESLTFAETDKEEEWCKKHNDKYHKKEDEKKFKKNPFHGGVSPVGRFVTVWQYCSISSWCECVCKDCYETYRHEKDKLDRLAGDAKNYKKQKKLVEKLYERAVFTVRDIDE